MYQGKTPEKYCGTLKFALLRLLVKFIVFYYIYVQSIYEYFWLCWNISRRINNMEAALLPDERTDLVSTNRLGHGWAYQKLANQQPSSELVVRMAVIGCQPRSWSRFVETKAVRWTQWLKGLTHIIYPPRTKL